MKLVTEEELRELRKKASLTQAELAKRAGVSQALIARIEAGDVDPRLSTVKKIYNAITDAEREKKLAKDYMSAPLINAGADETVDEAISKLRKHKISQMPVVEKGAVVGSISEKDILVKLSASKNPEELRKLRISSIMSEPFPIIGANTDLRSISALLEYHQAVLVQEGGKPVGIICPTNLLGVV